jgi:hypothetical protein
VIAAAGHANLAASRASLARVEDDTEAEEMAA